MDDASHGSPGTDLVPLTGAHVVPRELVRAVDIALGVGVRTGGVAVRLVGAGREVARVGVRAAGVLPGARVAGRALSGVTRPLVADGVRARRRTVAEAQRALERAVPAIIELIDVDAVLADVDLDELIGRIDVDAIAARVDVNAIVQRLDVDAVVEQTELGTIVARSTSGFASEALDVARAQTVGVDTLVTRLVDRLLRRRGEGPLGPPLLMREEPEEPAG